MSLAAPLWLLALIPLALVSAFLWSRRAAGASALAFGLRAAAAVALVVALVHPQPTHRDGPTVLVLDRSASVDSAMSARESAWVRSAVEQRACASPCRVVTFAGQASFAGVPASGTLPAADPLDRGRTDLAAALRLATGALPDGGRAIVLSDGLDTTGSTATLTAAARAASRAGVTVDAVPLSPDDAATPDAAVTRFTAPSPLHAGDPLTLQATVRSSVAGRAVLTLSRDGARIGTQAVALRAGDNPLLLTYRAPGGPGWHAYRIAVALDGDRVPQNDALDATTRIADAPRALVVEGDPGAAGSLPTILQDDGIAVTVATAAELPTSARGLAAADMIALADVPARALSAAQEGALQTAIRANGSGLLLLGGPHSLSLGGYAGTPLDAMLPVQSLAPGSVRKRRLALQLVLDRSSSMNDPAGGGVDPKITMARAAAQSALALTTRDDDELGVVAFDAAPHIVVPLERTTEANSTALGSLIDAIDADGGTDMLKGIKSGLSQLEQSNAPTKHMIVASDGVSEPGDYAPTLARMRREHITLSTVGLGQVADVDLLRRLARATGGQFYNVPDPRDLPSVFARDARRNAPSVAIRATLPVTVSAASPLVASLSRRTLPPLHGQVVTRVRNGASAALTTTVNGSTTPVLAQGQYGLGRVVVWTPGAGAWGADWLRDEPAVFSAAARWAQRGVATPALQPSLDPADPSRVVVDPLATSGHPLELAQLTATVRTPSGAQQPLGFRQAGPSRYEATLPAGGGAGVYSVTVSDEHGDSADALLAVPSPAELRPQPADASALGALAGATGGTTLLPNDEARALDPSRGDGLWRIPAGAAVLLLLAAVAADSRRKRGPRDHDRDGNRRRPRPRVAA
ncbi:MAG TPA: VWA domain-containing protein [Conexibacter sp.]